jgi:hypothetical protein
MTGNHRDGCSSRVSPLTWHFHEFTRPKTLVAKAVPDPMPEISERPAREDGSMTNSGSPEESGFPSVAGGRKTWFPC